MKLKSTIQLPIRVMIVGVVDYEKDHIEDVFSDKNGFDLVEMIGEFDHFTIDSVVEKIRNLNIDITFVDSSPIAVPSIELVCGIKKHSPDAKIIILSHSWEGEWTQKILKCGTDNLLELPIILDDLYVCLNEVLGKNKA